MMNMYTISLFHHNDYKYSDYDDDDDEIHPFHLYSLYVNDHYHKKTMYRINWNKYVNISRNLNTFLREFRMSDLYYMKLVYLI